MREDYSGAYIYCLMVHNTGHQPRQYQVLMARTWIDRVLVSYMLEEAFRAFLAMECCLQWEAEADIIKTVYRWDWSNHILEEEEKSLEFALG